MAVEMHFDSLRAKLDEYSRTYRHPNQRAFCVHGPFKIERYKKGTWEGMEISYKPGCYAIFSENGELLYIGKASAGRKVGDRLWRFSRKNPPSWLPDIALAQIVEVQQPFEAPSLEEYLIQALRPRHNAHCLIC